MDYTHDVTAISLLMPSNIKIKLMKHFSCIFERLIWSKMYFSFHNDIVTIQGCN